MKVKIKPNLEYQMQRVKFTFNKKPRNQLMEDLALYNSRYVSFKPSHRVLFRAGKHALAAKRGFILLPNASDHV